MCNEFKTVAYAPLSACQLCESVTQFGVEPTVGSKKRSHSGPQTVLCPLPQAFSKSSLGLNDSSAPPRDYMSRLVYIVRTPNMLLGAHRQSWPSIWRQWGAAPLVSPRDCWRLCEGWILLPWCRMRGAAPLALPLPSIVSWALRTSFPVGASYNAACCDTARPHWLSRLEN